MFIIKSFFFEMLDENEEILHWQLNEINISWSIKITDQNKTKTEIKIKYIKSKIIKIKILQLNILIVFIIFCFLNLWIVLFLFQF